MPNQNWITFPKWPVLRRVGRKTSVNQPTCWMKRYLFRIIFVTCLYRNSSWMFNICSVLFHGVFYSCSFTSHWLSLQLKIHQSQPNIYTLFWRFDLITRSSSEEAGTQFFWVLMRRGQLPVESHLRLLYWCDSWSSHQDSEELSTSFFWWRSRDEIETSK